MCEVLRLPRHQLARCTDPGCSGCHFCAGGLAHCTVCGGAEGSLPTDCPGEQMTELREKMVFDGVMDYTWRDGWVLLAARRGAVGQEKT